MTAKNRKNQRMQAGLAAAIVGLGVVAASPAAGMVEYRQTIANDTSACTSGGGPAVLVRIVGIKSSTGTLRVQSYRGIKADWLKKGKWINRIELPARAGSMSICMPVPESGVYGIAVRHDINGNGKTDITKDGGGMSNNPSINIFNLGKPSYKKTAFAVNSGVKQINIKMKYW